MTASTPIDRYSDSQHVTNLVLLVARLVQQVRQHEEANPVVDKAMDYLRRANLQPSILRGVKQNLGLDEASDRELA